MVYVVHVHVCTYIYTNVLTLDEGDPVADVVSVEGTDSTNSVGTQTDLSMRGVISSRDDEISR